MTKQDKLNEFIHIGMVSSYLMLVEDKSYDSVLQLQEKKKVKHVFFLPPVDVDTGDIRKEDVEAMIEHFIQYEDYEKCTKLKWLIDNYKCDVDGWWYLDNKFNTK